MEFTAHELWASTGVPVKTVIITMILMAFWCVYVAVERTIALTRARSQSRNLAASIGETLSSGDVAAAVEFTKKDEFKSSYLARILRAGLTEFDQRPDKHGIQAAERAIGLATVNEDADLKKGLAILATTGATCPFVGLVGTIFGIINAFQGMAEAGSGGLGAVSAGIAEALVTTAIGIAVAILGVWLFNFFNSKVESIGNDMTNSTVELLDWFEKRILPPLETAAK